MFYRNIQSIRNKIELIESLAVNDSIDIICLSEHWLNQNEMEVVRVKNFQQMYMATVERIIIFMGVPA